MLKMLKAHDCENFLDEIGNKGKYVFVDLPRSESMSDF